MTKFGECDKYHISLSQKGAKKHSTAINSTVFKCISNVILMHYYAIMRQHLPL